MPQLLEFLVHSRKLAAHCRVLERRAREASLQDRVGVGIAEHGAEHLGQRSVVTPLMMSMVVREMLVLVVASMVVARATVAMMAVMAMMMDMLRAALNRRCDRSEEEASQGPSHCHGD